MAAFEVHDEVTARYWTYVEGGPGRWSEVRRPHRITSLWPLKGVEFWYEDPHGYTEGQEHVLDHTDAQEYGRSRA